MDIAALLIKGLVVGFVVAIPIGPVGLLCTQRVLTSGRMHGLISGLGAATSDIIYSTIAALGLTIISDFLVAQQMWFRLFAGIFLCLLGVRTFLVKPVTSSRPARIADRLMHFNNYISMLLLALSNPVSILIIIGLFAGMGITGSDLSWDRVAWLVAGVSLGSMFWWITLSLSVGIFHKRLSDDALIKLAHIFGGFLTTVGVIVIIIAVA
jgi:threonine/homoserine/homoserine lactone efflux protein